LFIIFTAVISPFTYIRIIQFHLYYSVNIYSNWLREQFCNLSLYTLYILSVQRQTSCSSPLQSNANVWSFRHKFPGPRGPEGGPWPDYVAYVFVYLGNIVTCRLCRLTHLDHAQVTLQLRFSLSDVVKRFLRGPPLAGKPEPVIAGPATKIYAIFLDS